VSYSCGVKSEGCSIVCHIPSLCVVRCLDPCAHTRVPKDFFPLFCLFPGIPIIVGQGRSHQRCSQLLKCDTDSHRQRIQAIGQKVLNCSPYHIIQGHLSLENLRRGPANTSPHSAYYFVSLAVTQKTGHPSLAKKCPKFARPVFPCKSGHPKGVLMP